MNNDCIGCVVYSDINQEDCCIIHRVGFVEKCPCRFCIVKVSCRSFNDVCKEYDRLIRICQRRPSRRGK